MKMHKTIAVASVIAATAFSLSASEAYAGAAKPSNPEIVELTRVCTSNSGWQEFHYALATFEGKNQKPLMDDGIITFEVHGTNARYGNGDSRWMTISGSYLGQKIVTSGGENTIRVNKAAITLLGISWDLVRVRHDGWGSNVFPSGSVNC